MMSAPRPRSLLAVLCLLLAGPTGPGGLCPAFAQEAEAAASAEGATPQAEAAAGAEGATPQTPGSAEEEAEAGEEGEGDQEKGQNFVDSAKELQDKLGQLKALLAKKGDDVDPQLKERLSGLEKQLEGLNLDSLSGGVGPSGELSEFLGGCIMMSMRKVGMKRPTTLSALRRLAGGLTKEEGSEIDLVRMVGICVSELTDQELSQFKAGHLQVLPQALAAKATEASAKDVVIAIEDSVWDQLGPVAGAIQSQIVGDPDASRGVPAGVGLVAGVPLVLVFVFLGKKFLEMQERHATEKDGKKKKGKDK